MNFFVVNCSSKQIFIFVIFCKKGSRSRTCTRYLLLSFFHYLFFSILCKELLCTAMNKSINMKNLLKFSPRYKVSRLASWLNNSGRNVISPTTISKFPACYVAGRLQSYIRLMTRCLHFVVARPVTVAATKGCLVRLMGNQFLIVTPLPFTLGLHKFFDVLVPALCSVTS